LEDRRVGVEPGRAARDRVDLARGSCDGKVLAGPGAGDPRPAAPAQIEHECLAGEATGPDAADDVEPTAQDRRTPCRTGGRERRQRAPPSTRREDPRAPS